MKISVPLFKTNGLENLEVADIYKLKDAIPVNKIFEASKNLGSKLFDQVGGREGLINGVSNLLQAKKEGLGGAELLNRGLQMFGTSQASILSSVGGTVLDGAAGFLDLDPGIVNSIKLVGSGIETRGLNVDAFGANDLFQVLGGLSTDESYLSVLNVGMEASLWGSSITQAVKYNMPEVIKYVADAVDPEVLHLSLIYSSSAVMSQGDLDSLIATLEYLTPDEILGNNKDFIKYFLAAFKLNPTWDASLYPDKATLLKETMDRLDPMWYLFKRQQEEIIVSLAPFATLSTDAKTLLSMVPTLRNPIQMAKDFPITSTYAICQLLYPLSVANLK